MARISTYPIDSTPSVEDMVIGTEVDNLDVTKNYRIGDLLALGGNGTVTDIRLGDGDREGTAITISGVFTFLGTGGITTTVSGTTMTIDGSGISAAVTQITAGTNITVNPAGGTGNVTINSTDQYEGTVTNVAYTTNINAFTANVSNSGISPVITLNLNGGSAGQFLQQDGEWATVPGGSSGVTNVNFKTDGTALNVVSNTITSSGTMTGIWQGSNTQYVRGDGDLATFPTNIVNTVTTTDGVFIDLTPDAAVDGAVTITADLSAVDGTDTSGLFLSKDNVWSAPSGGSGGVTQITAGTNVTVSPIGGTGNVTINSTDQFIGTVTGVSGVLPITSSGGTTPAIGINNYTGADGTTAGTKGAVPAPAATDNVKFLKGDGTWATVPGGGGLVTSLTTTGTSGASTLISGVLNVPNYADNNTEYTLTTTGASGDIATLVGTVINVPTPVIPYTSLTTTGTSGASTLVGGVLNIPNYTAGGVISVDKTTPGTSTGNPIIVNPTTGNVLVQSMAYAGTTNIGHVPTGGDNTKFLRGDGTWVVPSGGGTYTAGIGLTLTGAEFTANVDGTQTVAANVLSATALRTYKVQVDSSDQLVVNVPWVNDNDDTGITGVTLATNNTGTWTVPLSESITGRELTITSNVYSGGSKVGYVPPSGSNTTFLRGDGTWVTPTDTVGAVLSVNQTATGTSIGTPIVVDPTTGNVLVKSMAYDGGTDVGHVPTGGGATTFLRGDGTWVTPTSGAGFVPVSALNNSDIYNVNWNNASDAIRSVVIGNNQPSTDSTAALEVHGRISIVDPQNRYNTFIGIESGSNLSQSNPGVNNTAVGNQALKELTTGSNNTAVGRYAHALNETGSANIVIGPSAMAKSISSGQNVAIGMSSMTNNLVGEENVAVGNGVMQYLVSSSFNTAVGTQALHRILNQHNTGIGYEAGEWFTTGQKNTIIGSNAGSRLNGQSGYNGDRNILIGEFAGTEINTGQSCIMIGSYTTSSNSVAVASINQIVIGNDAISKGDNTVVLGNNNVTETHLKGVVVLEGYTYAQLIALTAVIGMKSYRTDVPIGPNLWGSVISATTGTGVLPVFYNGTNWIYA